MGNYHALLSKSPAFYTEQAGFESNAIPPAWVRDRLAEEALTGKFDVSRSNICPKCFLARCVNGTCGC